jgi:hypothetical protein
MEHNIEEQIKKAHELSAEATFLQHKARELRAQLNNESVMRNNSVGNRPSYKIQKREEEQEWRNAEQEWRNAEYAWRNINIPPDYTSYPRRFQEENIDESVKCARQAKENAEAAAREAGEERIEMQLSAQAREAGRFPSVETVPTAEIAPPGSEFLPPAVVEEISQIYKTAPLAELETEREAVARKANELDIDMDNWKTVTDEQAAEAAKRRGGYTVRRRNLKLPRRTSRKCDKKHRKTNRKHRKRSKTHRKSRKTRGERKMRRGNARTRR